jgi:hypothetical protein
MIKRNSPDYEDVVELQILDEEFEEKLKDVGFVEQILSIYPPFKDDAELRSFSKRQAEIGIKRMRSFIDELQLK